MARQENPLESYIMDKTLEDTVNLDEIGEYTEKLSEISETEDDEFPLVRTRPQRTGWFQKIQPLVRKKDVRMLTFINLVFVGINVALLLVFVSFVVYATVQKVHVWSAESLDKPCLYQWTAWGECSAECRVRGGKYPTMKRYVMNNTIVQARGKYIHIVPCPPGLEDWVDEAPCNAHYCPQNITEFEFIYEFKGPNGTCHKMRKLDREYGLIHINDAVLYENCVFGNNT